MNSFKIRKACPDGLKMKKRLLFFLSNNKVFFLFSLFLDSSHVVNMLLILLEFLDTEENEVTWNGFVWYMHILRMIMLYTNENKYQNTKHSNAKSHNKTSPTLPQNT